jgi:DNA-binding NarL/FixJ family response regulator
MVTGKAGDDGNEDQTMTSRLLLADDHPLFRHALRTVIGCIRPGMVVDEVASLAEARACLAAAPVDLILLDLKLADCSGFIGLETLRAAFPAIPVVVISATEDQATIAAATRHGAAGFIPKSAGFDELRQRLGSWLDPSAEAAGVSIGDIVISPAQARILSRLRRGLLNKQIAYELGVTEATVKKHLTALFRKLGVNNRTQALILTQHYPDMGQGGDAADPANQPEANAGDRAIPAFAASQRRASRPA